MRWQFSELLTNLVERQPDALGEHDEGDSSKDLAREVSLSRPFALRPDKATLFVEPKRRGRDSAPAGDLSDTQ
jgi:hypothetical protein